MYEYLAATCARAGGLLAALSDDGVDRELLTAAGEILQALDRRRPRRGHRRLRGRPPRDRVVPGPHGVVCRDGRGLPARPCDQGLSRRGRLPLGEPLRRRVVGRGAGTGSARSASRSWAAPSGRIGSGPRLGSGDELEFSHADQAARALGIDTWDVHWRRLQEKPADPGRWYHVMALCDEARIGEVMAFAEANIDLAGIATGAGDELGLGPGFEPHRCLDYVLQELRRFPGRGTALIEAGLRSPVVRNRNMAVAALAGWPRGAWPGGLARVAGAGRRVRARRGRAGADAEGPEGQGLRIFKSG